MIKRKVIVCDVCKREIPKGDDKYKFIKYHDKYSKVLDKVLHNKKTKLDMCYGCYRNLFREGQYNFQRVKELGDLIKSDQFYTGFSIKKAIDAILEDVSYETPVPVNMGNTYYKLFVDNAKNILKDIKSPRARARTASVDQYIDQFCSSLDEVLEEICKNGAKND